MITMFPPSNKMALSFADVAADIEFKAMGKQRSDRDERDMIDIAYGGGLDFVIVRNAKKHTDPDFGWTALWCIRAAGHVLHVTNRLRKPTDQASSIMTAGRIYLFDSRLPHWTENGAATLICAAIDFAERPDASAIHAAFDGRLDGSYAQRTHPLLAQLTRD